MAKETTGAAQGGNPRKTDPAADLPDILKGRRQLTLGQKFPFGCHKGLACFTDCCADINILLAPWDVVRLARRLKIETSAFLEKYTLTPITKDLHLPVVMLKMQEDAEKKCHFVGDAGCAVYEDRPWSCRMYPMGMGMPPARAGENPEPVYFLFEDDFCQGRTENAEWDVDGWRADQGVVEQEEIEAGYRDIVGHPFFIGGRQLDPRRMELFHMVAYNLDTFRRFVFESTFVKRFEIDPDEVESMRTDDAALMRFGFRWLRFALFGEPTVKLRAKEAY